MKIIGAIAAAWMLAAGPAAASDFRSVAENAVVMYDAPSARATKLFVAARYTPVEIVVSLDQWVKVRDQAGDLAWVEKKSLSDARTVVVSVPQAEVRTEPNEQAPLVFRVQKGVALEIAELGASGWLKVRHRDGQTGFVRINQVWGL
jgi:SH3-like domain-containing protein